MTTADYLEQLQQDREDLVDNLEAKGITGLTGDETFTELVPEVLNIPSGGGTKAYTGHYDETGLQTIGWTSDDIKYCQDYGVAWNEEFDSDFKLTASELAGDNTSNTRFIPKNTSLTSFQGFKKLIAVPELTLSGYNTFSNCNALLIAKINPINSTANFTTTFEKCYSLQKAIITGSVGTLARTFRYCYSLKEIVLTLSNTSCVTTFESCYSLTTAKISGTATKVYAMFSNCTSLVSVDLSNLSITNGAEIGQMFYVCTSLRKIDMRSFDFTIGTNSSNMFGSSSSNGPIDNCLIIVADQTQKDWINTNFSRLTNVKTVAEYEASLNS